MDWLVVVVGLRLINGLGLVDGPWLMDRLDDNRSRFGLGPVLVVIIKRAALIMIVLVTVVLVALSSAISISLVEVVRHNFFLLKSKTDLAEANAESTKDIISDLAAQTVRSDTILGADLFESTDTSVQARNAKRSGAVSWDRKLAVGVTEVAKRLMRLAWSIGGGWLGWAIGAAWCLRSVRAGWFRGTVGATRSRWSVGGGWL